MWAIQGRCLQLWVLVWACWDTGSLVGMLFPFLGSKFPAVVAEGTSVLSTGAAHRRIQRRETECTGRPCFFWKKGQKTSHCSLIRD